MPDLVYRRAEMGNKPLKTAEFLRITIRHGHCCARCNGAESSPANVIKEW